MAHGLFKDFLPTINSLPLIAVVLVAAILTDSLTLAQVNVEPNKALLNEGDRTELLCRYGRRINYCRIEIPGEKVLNLSPEWNKPGFTYFGAGLDAGQCGVSIERIKAVNNGQVKCSLGVEGEELSGTIDLVVAMRPQQPIIELITKPDREGYFNEGSRFQARCTVRGGRPAANITWYIDDMPAYNKRVGRLEIEDMPNERNMTLTTIKQEIEWQVTHEDNGRKLICRSFHQTDRDSLPPQEGAFQLFVHFSPVPQPETLVYGLYLDHTAMVNITINAHPMPVVEWTVDGNVIPQGTSNGRFSAYEPQYLGEDNYNVTLAIGGLTLEDTTKTYLLKASNAFGSTEYSVRISSSSTPPSSGMEIGAIVGIVVAVAVLVLIVLLIIFARATGRWCFGGKSLKTQINETSDTESADMHAASTATTATTTAMAASAAEAGAISSNIAEGTASTTAAPTTSHESSSLSPSSSAPGHEQLGNSTKKFKRLPNFAAFFMRKNEMTKNKKPIDNEAVAVGNTAAAAATQPEATDGNDNEPKEDNKLVYAELVLKPAQHNPEPLPPKNSTEYAEIVYVQKKNPDAVKK